MLFDANGVTSECFGIVIGKAKAICICFFNINSFNKLAGSRVVGIDHFDSLTAEIAPQY